MDQNQWGQPPQTGPQPVQPEENATGPQSSLPMETEAMIPGYPFEEPEQAPELRQERSDNLYSRSEPFWERMPDPDRVNRPIPRDANYWNHPEVLSDDGMMVIGEHRQPEKPRLHLGAGTIRKVLIALSVLLAVGLLLYSTIFQARQISVVGNETVSAQEIIRLSGLKEGVNTLSIDQAAVTRRIQSNRYLRCTLVDVKWNSVTLHVRERIPVAYINHNGMQVILDNRGWVLEESLDTEVRYAKLIFVTGLNVRRCVLGQAVTLQGNDQMDVFTRIMVELKAMKGMELVCELDLSQMDRLYLVTRDGYTVKMGSTERIHEKLRAMMIVREKVIEMNTGLGTIDVTDPERPTFVPLNPLKTAE